MLIFLDFEASSLSDRSWPIEIGLAWLDGDGSVGSAGRLMATVSLTAPEVADLDAVAAKALTGNPLEEEAPLAAFHRALDKAPHPHRAEADARGLAEAWVEGL